MLLVLSRFCMLCKAPFHLSKPFCDSTLPESQTVGYHICLGIQASDENNLEVHVVDSHCRRSSAVSNLDKRRQKWRAQTSLAQQDGSMKPFWERRCSFCSCCLLCDRGKANTRVCDRCYNHLIQQRPAHNWHTLRSSGIGGRGRYKVHGVWVRS